MRFITTLLLVCKQTWIVGDVNNVSVQRFGRRVAVLLLLLVVNVPVLFLLVVRRLVGFSHLFSSVFSHLFSSSCRWVYGEMQSVVSGVWQVKCSYRRQVGSIMGHNRRRQICTSTPTSVCVSVEGTVFAWRTCYGVCVSCGGNARRTVSRYTSYVLFVHQRTLYKSMLGCGSTHLQTGGV